MTRKIIDLKTLAQQDTFDVQLPNDEILNLNKPSERLLIQFMAFEDRMKELSDLSAIEKSKSILNIQKDLVRDILKCNRNKVEIDDLFFEIHGIDFYLQQAIIKAYSEYVQEISQDPN